MPQELLPAMPPSVPCAEVETSTGYQRPCGFSYALSVSSTTPGCTDLGALRVEPTTSRRCLLSSITSAAPTVWPHCEVPAPRGRIATPPRHVDDRGEIGLVARHDHADRLTW